jgi:hypothetical protein
MSQTTTLTGPQIELEPTPVPGCAACVRLAADRTDARARRDMSRVVDCNVLLKRHTRGHA